MIDFFYLTFFNRVIREYRATYTYLVYTNFGYFKNYKSLNALIFLMNLFRLTGISENGFKRFLLLRYYVQYFSFNYMDIKVSSISDSKEVQLLLKMHVTQISKYMLYRQKKSRVLLII